MERKQSNYKQKQLFRNNNYYTVSLYVMASHGINELSISYNLSMALFSVKILIAVI